jgi:hypothetical protein
MSELMADRARHSLNATWPEVLIGTYNGGRANGALQDGTVPFNSTACLGAKPPPCSENNYDFSKPNNDYWVEIDNLVTSAASKGLVLLMNPFDTGLTVSSYPPPEDCDALTPGVGANGYGWLQAARLNGTRGMYDFGSYLGHRYAKYPNIIWILGNDFQTIACTTGPGANDARLVASLMAGIRAGEAACTTTCYRHLMSIETDFQTSFSSQYETVKPYLDLNGVYVYGPIYDEFWKAWNASPPLPSFLVEGNYEFENLTNILSHSPGSPPCTYTGIPGLGTGAPPPCSTMDDPYYDFNVRAQGWWAMTSGASGEIYANYYEADWNFDSGYLSGMNSVGAGQLRYILDFFASLPTWQSLVPDQAHNVVTAGYGNYSSSPAMDQDTNDYATAIWDATTKTLAVVYDPQGNALTVNLGNFSGVLAAKWYDPTTGTYRDIDGSPFENRVTREFTVPGNNGRGMKDWVLLLQVVTVPSASLPVPSMR